MVDSIDLSLPLRKRIFSGVSGSESMADFSPARRRLMSSSKDVPWISEANFAELSPIQPTQQKKEFKFQGGIFIGMGSCCDCQLFKLFFLL